MLKICNTPLVLSVTLPCGLYRAVHFQQIESGLECISTLSSKHSVLNKTLFSDTHMTNSSK